MALVDKRKLQRLIDASVKANNACHKAEGALNNFCEETWGFVPGERDLDNIIDAVYGGCGSSGGMKAEGFIKDMDNEARDY